MPDTTPTRDSTRTSWLPPILALCNWLAGIAYLVGFMYALALLLGLSVIFVLGGFPGPHGGKPISFASFMTALLATLPIALLTFLLAILHIQAGRGTWRRTARSLRLNSLLGKISALIVLILLVVLLLIQILPSGSIPLLDPGDEWFASLVFGFIASVYGAYVALVATLAWKQRIRDEFATDS